MGSVAHHPGIAPQAPEEFDGRIDRREEVTEIDHKGLPLNVSESIPSHGKGRIRKREHGRRDRVERARTDRLLRGADERRH